MNENRPAYDAVELLMENRGQVDANYRKRGRIADVRMYQQNDKGNPAGHANADGISIRVMDTEEPDRPGCLRIRDPRTARAVMELLTAYLATHPDDPGKPVNPFLCPRCGELAVANFNTNPTTRQSSWWDSDVQRVDCEKCAEPLVRDGAYGAARREWRRDNIAADESNDCPEFCACILCIPGA